jgi:hypothetical protein
MAAAVTSTDVDAIVETVRHPWMSTDTRDAEKIRDLLRVQVIHRIPHSFIRGRNAFRGTADSLDRSSPRMHGRR